MATIRLRDWTKEKIEEIRDAESHSSHDSVIKSLLKDRELAQFAGERAEQTEGTFPAEPTPPDAKPFEELTVVDELTFPDDGVLFLWCPNCATEIAHLSVAGTMSISVFEMECQHCLTDLNQHAIVAIEIGYPIEHRLKAGDLGADLKECVIEYWDRTLDTYSADAEPGTPDMERLVWQFGRYAREFTWEWPEDVPVVGFEAGDTYRNVRTGEYIDVVGPVTGNRNGLDSFEVKQYTEETDPADVESEVMTGSTIVDLIASRSLTTEAQSPTHTDT